MKEKRLIEFAAAWKEKNIEKIMSFFTDDCVYFSSVGKGLGSTYVGKEEVLEGIKDMILFDNVADVMISNLRIYENFGFWEWTYFLKNGKTEIGCDFFEFEEGKIKLKNAFRKISLERSLK